MDFSAARFEQFCLRLRVDTKEKGRIPLRWLGTQRYLIQEIEKAAAQDIHTYFVLKGRQVGISTVTLALDLYWLFKNPGLQGSVITDTDENRELFRSYLTQYMESLPTRLKPKQVSHNRVQLTLANGSRLVYLVAGTRKQGNLGRGKAVNFAHGTETSSWGDEDGYSSLLNTLAQDNPNRMYMFESTARGYNMFYECWEIAKKSKLQKAIFIGWWRNEYYQKARNSPEFNAFWDGQPTSDERVWIKDVMHRYGVNITPEQLAWWRWYVQEQMRDDENMALQEMPPTEEYAFQLSGSKYFDAERTNKAYQEAMKKPCRYFRYKFGVQFEHTEFIETTEDMAEVTIWEWPNERGVYVMGADPAYGSSEWADEFAACILRCYADKAEQVLEVGTTAWTEQQFAWVIAHLAGFYGGRRGGCVLALEMQGPGGAVFNELKNLQRMAGSLPSKDPRSEALGVVAGIQNYYYKRQDTFTVGFALQWQTNAREKIRMFSTLRGYFGRDMVLVSSTGCLQQFRNIHQTGDKIGGEGRAKDDRVVALCIATVAWNDQLLLQLTAANRTYHLENRPTEEIKQLSPIESNISKYLNRNRISLRAN
jgi:hypothetical protein